MSCIILVFHFFGVANAALQALPDVGAQQLMEEIANADFRACFVFQALGVCICACMSMCADENIVRGQAIAVILVRTLPFFDKKPIFRHIALMLHSFGPQK